MHLGFQMLEHSEIRNAKAFRNQVSDLAYSHFCSEPMTQFNVATGA